MKKLTVGFAIVSLLLPVVSLAQLTVPAPPFGAPPPVISSITDTNNFFITIVDWVFYFLIVLAVFFVLFAAYVYLTSSGEPDRVKKANHMLLYAAIAVAVGILARTIPNLVGSFFGVTGL